MKWLISSLFLLAALVSPAFADKSDISPVISRALAQPKSLSLDLRFRDEANHARWRVEPSEGGGLRCTFRFGLEGGMRREESILTAVLGSSGRLEEISVEVVRGRETLAGRGRVRGPDLVWERWSELRGQREPGETSRRAWKPGALTLEVAALLLPTLPELPAEGRCTIFDPHRLELAPATWKRSKERFELKVEGAPPVVVTLREGVPERVDLGPGARLERVRR